MSRYYTDTTPFVFSVPLIGSGTTGLFYRASADPITPPPSSITVTADLTNFGNTPPNYTGYIDYTINIVQVSPADNVQVSVRITYVGAVRTLTILTTQPGVSITYNGFFLDITKTNATCTFSLTPQDFQVVIQYSNTVQLGGIPAVFIFPPLNNTEVRVPIIDIQGQTTFDGNYLSDMKFIIQDKYKYYCNENIIKKCGSCKLHYYPYGKLKTTTFIDNNIPLQKVVKGKGKTLQDKVLRFFNAGSYGPNFQDFYRRFIQYAMLKYILIRLIYGEFDLNKLCKNYNKQFFKDLRHTRFCGFIEFFEDPINQIIDFDQFYIKCDQDCSL